MQVVVDRHGAQRDLAGGGEGDRRRPAAQRGGAARQAAGGEPGEDGRRHHQAGEDPVGELDPRVPGGLGHHAAVAERPVRAAQAGAGQAHDRPARDDRPEPDHRDQGQRAEARGGAQGRQQAARQPPAGGTGAHAPMLAAPVAPPRVSDSADPRRERPHRAGGCCASSRWWPSCWRWRRSRPPRGRPGAVEIRVGLGVELERGLFDGVVRLPYGREVTMPVPEARRPNLLIVPLDPAIDGVSAARWRGMGRDGHPAGGTLRIEVRDREVLPFPIVDRDVPPSRDLLSALGRLLALAGAAGPGRAGGPARPRGRARVAGGGVAPPVGVADTAGFRERAGPALAAAAASWWRAWWILAAAGAAGLALAPVALLWTAERGAGDLGRLLLDTRWGTGVDRPGGRPGRGGRRRGAARARRPRARAGAGPGAGARAAPGGRAGRDLVGRPRRGERRPPARHRHRRHPQPEHGRVARRPGGPGRPPARGPPPARRGGPHAPGRRRGGALLRARADGRRPAGRDRRLPRPGGAAGARATCSTRATGTPCWSSCWSSCRCSAWAPTTAWSCTRGSSARRSGWTRTTAAPRPVCATSVRAELALAGALMVAVAALVALAPPT